MSPDLTTHIPSRHSLLCCHCHKGPFYRHRLDKGTGHEDLKCQGDISLEKNEFCDALKENSLPQNGSVRWEQQDNYRTSCCGQHDNWSRRKPSGQTLHGHLAGWGLRAHPPPYCPLPLSASLEHTMHFAEWPLSTSLCWAVHLAEACTRGQAQGGPEVSLRNQTLRDGRALSC